MPRLIPVIDVLGQQAVHAIGGRRDDYRPVRSILRSDSDPIALATAIRDTFGTRDLYLADLDAIRGAVPATSLYSELASLGLSTWVDAGLRDSLHVRSLLDADVARVVVGLETVRGPAGLCEILEAGGPDRVAFSLDLREGRPIIPHDVDWGTDDPLALAGISIESGVRSVILLDLAHVGTGRGSGTLELLRKLAHMYPRIEWIVGGGVRDRGDLEMLGDEGAAGVLVASALHNGNFRPEDVRHDYQMDEFSGPLI
jgi:phosphoribosylformimino-5-aminoimidazole carboxamide ribotide isomerase